MIGLATVLGAINIGTSSFFIGAFGPSLGLADTFTTKMIFMVLITGSHALFNHLGIRLTTKLTDLSGYLIIGGAVLGLGSGLSLSHRRTNGISHDL